MKTATKSSTARDATFTPRECLSPKLRNSLEKLQSPHSAIPRGRDIPRGSTLRQEPIRIILVGLPNFSFHGDAPGPRICGLAHSDFPGPHHSPNPHQALRYAPLHQTNTRTPPPITLQFYPIVSLPASLVRYATLRSLATPDSATSWRQSQTSRLRPGSQDRLRLGRKGAGPMSGPCPRGPMSWYCMIW